MADRATRPLESSEEVHYHNSLHANRERRLALEVRLRRFGFAYFEGANLLDWGARSCADSETAARKVRSLVARYSPGVAVARRMRRVPKKTPYLVIDAMQRIRLELKRQKVRSIIVNRNTIQEFFAGHGCRNKHQIASRLADQFPTLKWILPKPRRPWSPEPHSMIVFDAVATAVAYNAIRKRK